MKKKLLLASAFVSLLGATAQTQTPVITDQKWDGPLEILLQDHQKTITTRAAQASGTATTGMIISCSDVAAVAEAIELAGYEANIISDKIISATVAVSYIPTLAEMEEVEYMNGPRQFRASMNSTREVTSVNKIHAKEGLETPFTGKGVIIGVIDQGFQYKHHAFLDKDGNTRVRAVWNHQANSRPTENIPSTGDNMPNSHGHATHVTNIAAGSKVEGNDFYGIAPDAEIIMIPSTFQDNKVLEETKYIHDFAKKEGKPYVINMSFGSQMGPHDGTDDYSTAMNKFSQPGGILVAAMGNEGGMKLHAYHKFTKDKEKIFLVVQKDDYTQSQVHLVDLWEQTADGDRHLKINPFVFTKTNKKKDFKNSSFWNNCLSASGVVEPFNQKEHFYFSANISKIQEGNSSRCFGLEIEGNTGDEFHAWVNPSSGEFYKSFAKDFAEVDNEYCVGEGAASIPQAIAVASFNGNDGYFTSAIDGGRYSMGGSEGDISSFSSRGPSLGAEPKPLVAAPGNNVSSAISRYGQGFDKNATEIVAIIGSGMKKDYYASMSGTSMASPTVTGIVALWLEANPQLTYDQIKNIIKETANKDRFTKNDEWDIRRGYGKINAYEGLKKALELAENTGINDQLNTETPITLQKGNGNFRILFNNDESYANISLYNASGVEVKRKQLNDIRRGNETVLTTNGLPAGVYVVRISTTAHTTAKKMLVK